jgi:assimilatory nitrate reductase catalytic subunit
MNRGDAFEEWRMVSAGRLCDYSGITYDMLDAHGGIQWPFPAGANEATDTRSSLRRRRVRDRGRAARD